MDFEPASNDEPDPEPQQKPKQQLEPQPEPQPQTPPEPPAVAEVRSASQSWKVIFVALLVAVAALLALHYGATGDGHRSVPGWVNSTRLVFIVLTVVFTIYSGAGYVKSATRILRSNS